MLKLPPDLASRLKAIHLEHRNKAGLKIREIQASQILQGINVPRDLCMGYTHFDEIVRHTVLNNIQTKVTNEWAEAAVECLRLLAVHYGWEDMTDDFDWNQIAEAQKNRNPFWKAWTKKNKGPKMVLGRKPHLGVFEIRSGFRTDNAGARETARRRLWNFRDALAFLKYPAWEPTAYLFHLTGTQGFSHAQGWGRMYTGYGQDVWRFFTGETRFYEDFPVWERVVLAGEAKDIPTVAEEVIKQISEEIQSVFGNADGSMNIQKVIRTTCRDADTEDVTDLLRELGSPTPNAGTLGMFGSVLTPPLPSAAPASKQTTRRRPKSHRRRP